MAKRSGGKRRTAEKGDSEREHGPGTRRSRRKAGKGPNRERKSRQPEASAQQADKGKHSGIRDGRGQPNKSRQGGQNEPQAKGRQHELQIGKSQAKGEAPDNTQSEKNGTGNTPRQEEPAGKRKFSLKKCTRKAKPITEGQRIRSTPRPETPRTAPDEKTAHNATSREIHQQA